MVRLFHHLELLIIKIVVEDIDKEYVAFLCDERAGGLNVVAGEASHGIQGMHLRSNRKD